MFIAIIKSFLCDIISILKVYFIPAILIATLLCYFRHKSSNKYSRGCFFYYMYVFLIYCTTIFSRIVQLKTFVKDHLGIKPLVENPWYVVSFVENIIMFILFGILYMVAFKNKNAIRQNVICAFFISLSIEVMQGIFYLGEAQIIDIFANVLGAWIGAMCIKKYRSYREQKK